MLPNILYLQSYLERKCLVENYLSLLIHGVQNSGFDLRHLFLDLDIEKIYFISDFLV